MLMPGRQEMLARTNESGPTRIYILDVFLGYLSIILGGFSCGRQFGSKLGGK